MGILLDYAQRALAYSQGGGKIEALVVSSEYVRKTISRVYEPKT